MYRAVSFSFSRCVCSEYSSGLCKSLSAVCEAPQLSVTVMATVVAIVMAVVMALVMAIVMAIVMVTYG